MRASPVGRLNRWLLGPEITTPTAPLTPALRAEFDSFNDETRHWLKEAARWRWPTDREDLVPHLRDLTDQWIAAYDARIQELESRTGTIDSALQGAVWSIVDFITYGWLGRWHSLVWPARRERQRLREYRATLDA